MVTLYGIKNCDTVKKACRWLEDNNIEYQFHDFKKSAVTEALARSWIDQFGLETVINKRGTTYRQLDTAVKESLNHETAIELILDNNSIVKRPILSSDKGALIGFSADQYQTFFAK